MSSSARMTRRLVSWIKRETFAAKPVLDREQTNFAPRHQPLLHEVQTPFFVEVRWRGRNVTADQANTPLSARPNLQTLVAVEAAQALVVHHQAFTLEENLEPSPSESRSLLRKAAQSVADMVVTGALTWLVSRRRSGTAREATRLPLAHSLGFERPHRFFAR